MTRQSRWTGWTLAGAIIFLCVANVGLAGQQYAALEGVTSVSAVFDLKTDSPQRTALYLDLMHQVLKDENFTAITERPDFAVVVSGAAIRHISRSAEGWSPEEQDAMAQIATTVAAMAADGIRVEACLFAAGRLGVAPDSFLPEVDPVGNGWLSLIGYQMKGYSLVPVY